MPGEWASTIAARYSPALFRHSAPQPSRPQVTAHPRGRVFGNVLGGHLSVEKGVETWRCAVSEQSGSRVDPGPNDKRYLCRGALSGQAAR